MLLLLLLLLLNIWAKLVGNWSLKLNPGHIIGLNEVLRNLRFCQPYQFSEIMRNYNGKNVVVHYAELRCYYDPHCRYWSDWFIHNACHMANATVASSIGWLELLIMWLLFFVMNINVNSLHAFYLFHPRQMSKHCANWGFISWEITSQWKNSCS